MVGQTPKIDGRHWGMLEWRRQLMTVMDNGDSEDEDT